MQENSKAHYLLVDTRILPESFAKVVYAKQLLAQNKAKNLSEATRLADISRSAFYRYRDCVFAYESQNTRQVATISAELSDEAGVLSSLLTALSNSGANILTINQNIPVDGVAPVAISLRCAQMERQIEEVVGELASMRGVVRIRLLTA